MALVALQETLTLNGGTPVEGVTVRLSQLAGTGGVTMIQARSFWVFGLSGSHFPGGGGGGGLVFPQMISFPGPVGFEGALSAQI